MHCLSHISPLLQERGLKSRNNSWVGHPLASWIGQRPPFLRLPDFQRRPPVARPPPPPPSPTRAPPARHAPTASLGLSPAPTATHRPAPTPAPHLPPPGSASLGRQPGLPPCLGGGRGMAGHRDEVECLLGAGLRVILVGHWVPAGDADNWVFRLLRNLGRSLPL